MYKFTKKLSCLVGFMAVTLIMGGQHAIAQNQQQGAVISQTIKGNNASQVDFVNAKAMPLPQNSTPFDPLQSTINALMRAPDPDDAVGGVSPGEVGNGVGRAVFLGASAAAAESDGGIGSQEWGTSNLPFSTARADLTPTATNTAYPYRASGKLFFNIGTSTFVCSASMIRRGIVVTAAHCVARFGGRQLYTNFRFVPGYRNGVAPYGVWTANTVSVVASYLNGTDACAVAGVVCANDVAVIRLNPQAGVYAGTSTGWYAYGWNGAGFANNVTHLTQIGYPGCLDNGLLMQRNDVQGVKNAAVLSNNTTYGSLMCAGSSGGPLLANFGIRPTLTSTTAGTFPNPNIVIGVTSWGFVSSLVKQQGASPFTSGNILPLVASVCPPAHPACI